MAREEFRRHCTMGARGRSLGAYEKRNRSIIRFCPGRVPYSTMLPVTATEKTGKRQTRWALMAMLTCCAQTSALTGLVAVAGSLVSYRNPPEAKTPNRTVPLFLGC